MARCSLSGLSIAKLSPFKHVAPALVPRFAPPTRRRNLAVTAAPQEEAAFQLDTFRSEMLKSFSMPLLSNAGKEDLDCAKWVVKRDGSIEYEPGPISKSGLCDRYGLEPRDLRTLDVSIADTSPLILVRSKAILYTSSLVRALISTDHITLFASKDPDSKTWYGEVGAPHVIAKSMKETINLLSLGTQSGRLDEYGSAYEIRALEALLLIIVRGYTFVLRRLREDSEAVMHDLSMDVSHEKIRKLVDAAAMVDDYILRIRGFQDALAGQLKEEQGLCRFYLSAREAGKPRAPSRDDEVELLLESVLQRADEVHEIAAGLQSKLKSADSALTLVLSATRNRLLKLEISVALAVFSLTIAQTVFACFGQNLVSGLEYHPYAFYWISGSTLLVSLLISRLGLARLSKMRRSHLNQGITTSTTIIRR